MLSTTGRLVMTAIVLLSTSFAQDALAANDVPPKPEGDYVLVCNTTHKCVWILRSVADGDQKDKKPGKQPAKQTNQVCHYGGAPQACTSTLGNCSRNRFSAGGRMP